MFGYGSVQSESEISFVHACTFRPVRRHCGALLLSKGYFSLRIQYYTSSTASFNLKRLLLSGDVLPNPGPVEKCKVCERSIARNHRRVKCTERNCRFISSVHKFRWRITTCYDKILATVGCVLSVSYQDYRVRIFLRKPSMIRLGMIVLWRTKSVYLAIKSWLLRT